MFIGKGSVTGLLAGVGRMLGRKSPKQSVSGSTKPTPCPHKWVSITAFGNARETEICAKCNMQRVGRPLNGNRSD